MNGYFVVFRGEIHVVNLNLPIVNITKRISGFRCQFCKGSLMKVHNPKLYNKAHLLSLNIFTASKGSNIYILFTAKVGFSRRKLSD